MGEVVRQLADRVYEGYCAENLHETPDLVVIGNALSRGNPEVELVLDNSLPFASMPEVFAALLIGTKDQCRTSVVVAGTHGKTTTSGAVAFILERAGRKPGYFIGGMPRGLSSAVRPVATDIAVEDRVVVLEGDEYDSAFFAKFSKFHSYRPDLAVVTSLEFDHADIYHSIEDIEAEFTKFASRVPEDGVLLVCDTGNRVRELARTWSDNPAVIGAVLGYGEQRDSSYRLISRNPGKERKQDVRSVGQELELFLEDHSLAAWTPLCGHHNAMNLLAAAAVCHKLGLKDEEISDGISAFTGVSRRQQVIFDRDGVTVMEDFAHHPTEVKATLSGLKESFSGRRLIAVFEPRSNTSRRSFFQTEYGQAFSAADLAVILEVADAGGYHGTGTQVVPLNVKQIVDDIKQAGGAAISFSTVARIEEYLLKEVEQGDLIVLMSNGDFGGIAQSLPKRLRKKE